MNPRHRVMRFQARLLLTTNLAVKTMSSWRQLRLLLPYRNFSRALIGVWFLVIISIACMPAFAASFDCTLAKAPIEKMVCADGDLSRLDEMMASDYSELLLARPWDEDEVKPGQRAWLARRNACRDRACVLKAYTTRIGELRVASCAAGPFPDNCDDKATPTFPQTTDGRLMLLSREECRTGESGSGYTIKFKNQSDAIAIQADCIEAGVYDPCDDAGGTWGAAQCAWANLEVANRRIRRAEAALTAIAHRWKRIAQALPSELEASSQRWGGLQQQFCSEQNRLYDGPMSDVGEPMGFCMGRTAKERADKLELLVRDLQKSSIESDGNKMLQFFRQEPRFERPVGRD